MIIILRRIWLFNGGEALPSDKQVKELLPFIGWDKVTLQNNRITLAPGMELDFGGLGKEYAVDKSMQIANRVTSSPVLINFGGDICANKALHSGKPWQVGIDHPGFKDKQPVVIKISAIATSGDACRFIINDGIRYSHVLNPKTGLALSDAPKSVTVTAPTCIQAGFIATLALLQGDRAEDFLNQQHIGHWCIR